MFDRVTASAGVRGRLRAAAHAAREAVAAEGALPDGGGDHGGVAPGSAAAMTHSWLFTGPPGSGRSVAAEAFAAALLCTDPDVVGCGRCQGCSTASARTHGDLLWVATDRVMIPVQQVRDEILPWAHRLPTTADWRVVVIEDADRLGDEGANALLKAVEEPPKRTVFLLCAPTTDPEDFSVTLRSRCRHVYVPTPSTDDVMAVLREGHPELTDAQAEWAGTVSNGHIGRAMALATDEKTRDWRARALNLVEAVFDPAASYLRTREMATEAEAEAKRRMEPVDAEELEKLTAALGMGARGKGAQAATRGSAGVVKELEANQKRRRTRVQRDLVDLALTDMMGLFRDALLLASGVDMSGGGAAGTGGAGGDGAAGAGGGAASGPRAINPDRHRTAQELVRRVPPEGLLACIDAITEARTAMTRNVRAAVALDGMMGAMQRACRVGIR